MNEATIKRLNQINQDFYRITATSFDQTRNKPWPGWEALQPFLRPPLRVLDVGCGNGRFGRFLADLVGAKNLRYHGIDSNPALLEFARAALTDVDAQLEERDIITQPLEPGDDYNLVVLFGVIHHIPGAQARQDFMRTLAEYVAPEGYLAYAAWCFYDFERFRRRILPWPADLEAEVEPHDYLLDWQRDVTAVRYCHYVDETEHALLNCVTGLMPILTYHADGHTNTTNRYSLLQRKSTP